MAIIDDLNLDSYQSAPSSPQVDSEITFDQAVPYGGAGVIDQQPGGGVSGSDLTDIGYSFDPITSSLYEDIMPSYSSEMAAANGETEQANAIAAAREAMTAAKSGDPAGIDYIKQLTSKIGDKGVAALIQGGFGMLSGAAAGKMQDARWKREDDIRQQEIARKAAYSKPGNVASMSWTPGSAQGTGLLGAKVG